MSELRVRRIIVALAFPLYAVAGQSPPTMPAPALGELVWRTAFSFSEIDRVLLQPDGSVLVIDVEGFTRSVRRIADRGRTVSALGRAGAGPAEYREPTGLVLLAGDSVAIVDPLARRILIFTPTGAFSRTVPMGASPTDGWLRGSVSAFDAFGRVYYEAQQFDRERRGFAQSGTLFRRAFFGTDEVAVRRIALRRAEQVGNGVRPFRFRDGWDVGKDGTVAHVSADPYRVIWLRDGRVVDSTPVQSYRQIPVDAAERLAFENRLAQMPVMGVGNAAAGANTRRPSVSAASYPISLPPFGDAGRSVLIDPWNRVWVTRLGRSSQRVDTVEVFTMRESRPVRLSLPPGRRLLALSTAGLLFAAQDDDHLVAVEWYAWPKRSF